MGQQTSRKSADCSCGCTDIDNRRRLDCPDFDGPNDVVEQGNNVHRYVSAVTDRWRGRSCACRRRRRRVPPPCVCTAYRSVPVPDLHHDDRFYEECGIPGVVGCIDGTHIAIVRPALNEERFYNRKQYHSLNVQIICDSDLNIMSVDASYPGATNDCTIWQNHPLYSYLLECRNNGEVLWVLGDSGYPQRVHTMTPILNAATGSKESVYTKMHTSARNCVERCIDILKARFRCLLAARTLHYDPHTAARIVNACCVLHNIAHGARLVQPVLTMEEQRYEQQRQLSRVYNEELTCTRGQTNYERLTAVLTLGARELRRELDAIVINADGENSSERDGVPVPTELYVLSVAPRTVDGEPSGEARRRELAAVDATFNLQQQLQMMCHTELKALLVRSPRPLCVAAEQALTLPHKVHTQVDYIHCLVPDLQEITACSFYWGKMDRYEAERLLDGKPEGTFLLRDSAQEEHLFSVSFRKYGRSLHARIEHCQRRFSFDSHDPAVYSARTVTGLIEHYKDPACVMFFEPMLTSPLPRTEPFALQQLARAVIVSHTTYDGVEQLPLPARLRAYLKEYHYRQRVRVRRLEPDLACYEHC